MQFLKIFFYLQRNDERKKKNAKYFFIAFFTSDSVCRKSNHFVGKLKMQLIQNSGIMHFL